MADRTTGTGEVQRIVGIDPGSRVTGYAAIERRGRQLRLMTSGVIRLDVEAELAERLGLLQRELEQVLAAICPHVVAVEDVFTHRNPRSALLLGQARGVALASAARREVPVHAYPPATVKRSVAGHGRADKQQLQRMVQMLLSVRHTLRADESDAMAVAICEAMSQHVAVPAAQRTTAPSRRGGRRGAVAVRRGVAR